MKRSMIELTILGTLVGFSVLASPAVGDGISWGAVGAGASATLEGSAVKLHTDDGALGSGYVRLSIDGGIALNAITALSYTGKLSAFDGASCPLAEVILNIDANGDNALGGTGLAWMTAAHNPSALGGDNFLSGDSWPFATSADADNVTRDALGSVYYYWSANEARDGSGPFWTQFSNVLSEKLPYADIASTSKVMSIDFALGTSGNWQNADFYLSGVNLNGTTFLVPEPGTLALLVSAGLGLMAYAWPRRRS